MIGLARVLLVVALTAPVALAQESQNPPPEAATETPAPVPSAPLPSATVSPQTAASSSTTGSSYGVADKKATFGAVMAPAALPGGSNAAYIYLGVQEVGAGYRQGVSMFEFEGRARFNYLWLSLSLDVVGKLAAYNEGGLEIAPYIGLGLVMNTGARYFEEANFSHLGLKMLAGGTLTYRFTETLRGVANVEIPYDLSFSPSGAGAFNPVAGVGAEMYLGEDISALALGSLGVSTLKEPLGVTVVRLGYQVRLGIGYRFF